MRRFRWRGRFRTGDASADRRNRAFVDCLNKFINAAAQREHCCEMEDLIGQLSSEADNILREGPVDRDFKQEFGKRLLAALPLRTFGSNACRECGLCAVNEAKVSDQLEIPGQCLFEKRNP